MDLFEALGYGAAAADNYHNYAAILPTQNTAARPRLFHSHAIYNQQSTLYRVLIIRLVTVVTAVTGSHTRAAVAA